MVKDCWIPYHMQALLVHKWGQVAAKQKHLDFRPEVLKSKTFRRKVFLK